MPLRIVEQLEKIMRNDAGQIFCENIRGYGHAFCGPAACYPALGYRQRLDLYPQFFRYRFALEAGYRFDEAVFLVCGEEREEIGDERGALLVFEDAAMLIEQPRGDGISLLPRAGAADLDQSFLEELLGLPANDVLLVFKIAVKSRFRDKCLLADIVYADFDIRLFV